MSASCWCRAADQTGSRVPAGPKGWRGDIASQTHKVFSSGAPIGDLLMTGAILESENEPPMMLHFGIPMNSPHVKVLDTWHTLGMRRDRFA